MEPINSPRQSEEESHIVTSPTIVLPPNCEVTKKISTLEIKRRWLYSEWNPVCQFSHHINPVFQNRRDIKYTQDQTKIQQIETIFHNVRGKWALWGEERETAKWKKVTTNALDPQWFRDNVEILYPSEDRFPVNKIKGMVLWYDPNHPKLQLYEGNHRVSAWLAAPTPQPIPCIIYIGKSTLNS